MEKIYPHAVDINGTYILRVVRKSYRHYVESTVLKSMPNSSIYIVIVASVSTLKFKVIVKLSVESR